MSNLIALPAGTELVGDYRIERVLGAGGFGITYLARETALARAVTIKEYFPSDFAARDPAGDAAPRSEDSKGDYQWGLDRFIEEAQILARFDHPNIVRVYRYFRANATAYMVLQFEEGQHLKSWLRTLGRAPRQKELDAILAPLLDALEVVHAADFLHRDIAPDNIIIRNDGSPVLIDFGSARGEMAGHSKTVSALVKPGYSPYEQYAETSRTQGPWTDIYALAATLYTAITGKRPPDAPTRMVRDTYTPAAEASLGAYRKRFLGAIDKALNLRIDDRPQSIAAWRGELLGPDKSARPPELPARTGWLPRRDARNASASREDDHAPPRPDAPGRPGGLLDYMDGLRGSNEALEGKSNPASPIEAKRETGCGPRDDLDVLSRPPGAVRDGDPGAAVTPADKNRTPAKGTVKLTSPPVFKFPGFGRRQEPGGHTADAANVEGAPDQLPVGAAKPKPAAKAAARKNAPAATDAPIDDWTEPDDAARPGFFARLRSDGGAKPSRAKSNDHQGAGKAPRPASAMPPDAVAQKRALPALRPRQRPSRKFSYASAMSKAAGWSRFAIKIVVAIGVASLAVANQDRMRDYLREAAILSKKTDVASMATIPAPAQNPRTRQARLGALGNASGSTTSGAAKVPFDRFAATVAVPSGAASRSVSPSFSTRTGPDAAYGLPAVAGSSRLNATSAITTAAIGRTPAPKAALPQAEPPAPPPQSRLEQSLEDQPAIAALAMPAPHVRIERNPLLLTVEAHAGAIRATAITADGQRAVTASTDATIEVIDLSDGRIARTLRLDHGPAAAIAIQKNLLATGHRGGFIGIWDLETGAKIAALRRNEADIWDLAFTGTEGRLAAAAHDWKVALWDLSQPASPVRLFEAHDNAVMSLAVSPDGRYLVTGGADRRVILHDLDTLDEVRTFSRQPDFVKALAFSPDGDTIAAASLGGDIRVGTRRTRSLSRRLRGHDGDVNALAFSPQGTVLASAGTDGTVRLWDIRKRRTLKTLAGHRGAVVDLAFSGDGQRLISADEGGKLSVWSISAALD